MNTFVAKMSLGSNCCFQHLLKNCCQPKLHKTLFTRGITYSRLSSVKKQALNAKLKLIPTVLRQAARQTTTTAGSAVKAIPAHGQKIVGGWLVGCAGMCAGAILLGGLTRLTESGLSMVDWKLFKDMAPPGSQQAWEEEFERYKSFPEFKYYNNENEMTLSDFKFIFYMEWGHRLWGRTTGMVFLLPALYFLKKGWISKAMKPRLGVFTALLAFQGFLGWYMVKSGLQDDPENTNVPRVSQYRLASHLGSALLLYTLFLWSGFSHLLPQIKMPQFPQLAKLRGMSHGIKALVFITALSGAFVAGMDAGLTYNSFPKMADRWIPDDIMALSPKWKNLFENATTVQFNHRYLAEGTMVLIGAFWFMCRKAPLHPRAKMAVNGLFAMALAQGTLGVATLLMYVPTWLAATHQSGSVALLSFAVWLSHELRRLPK